MYPKPNLIAFTDELTSLIDKLFPDLHSELRFFLKEQLQYTDEFTIPIEESFENEWDDEPVQAVRSAVENFTDQVRSTLSEMFGSSSILPDMLLKLPDFFQTTETEFHPCRYKEYVSEIVDAAQNTSIKLTAEDEDFRSLFSAAMLGLVRSSENPNLSFGAVLDYVESVPDGNLVAALYHPWRAIIDELQHDWELAYKIPPYRWEEIIAGAFEQAGFDEVILTPRSGDLGRDVIATRQGFGCIKILGSVKAYAPNRTVEHDDVRALVGVLSTDNSASKGILMTTASFAPRIPTDRFLSTLIPYRLELMDGHQLRAWLINIFSKNG